MNKILKKESLNPTVTKMIVEAPLVAKKAEAGQFIILRPLKNSERIPLTIADYDRENGTITIIYQIVGATTIELDSLKEGEYIEDFVGPLGTSSKLDNLKKVAIIGGGVGCAIAYPIAKKLKSMGAEVDSIVGFRNKDLIILEDEFYESEKVVKRKKLELKPMDEEEAIIEMEMLGHDFFVFRDSDTDKICVLYKRKNGI